MSLKQEAAPLKFKLWDIKSCFETNLGSLVLSLPVGPPPFQTLDGIGAYFHAVERGADWKPNAVP